jgi:hypothetical protein
VAHTRARPPTGPKEANDKNRPRSAGAKTAITAGAVLELIGLICAAFGFRQTWYE